VSSKNFPAALLGRSLDKGGVRGGAPSFVEFSTGVRSWKAVLSWVVGAEMRGGQGSKAVVLELENALLCFQEPSVFYQLAVAQDLAATRVS
jgi:hypothetical protein